MLKRRQRRTDLVALKLRVNDDGAVFVASCLPQDSNPAL